MGSMEAWVGLWEYFYRRPLDNATRHGVPGNRPQSVEYVGASFP